MKFYHDLVTRQSWQVLQLWQRQYKFILIGGWAVWLYTQGLKSKDIDVVMEYDELAKVKQELEVVKNDRLKKYEARQGGVEIDIYVPFYSNPGLPAEELAQFKVKLGGLGTVQPEVLAILKQAAWLTRQGTVKGRKDAIDWLGLVTGAAFDGEEYQGLMIKYELGAVAEQLKVLVGEVTPVEELGWSEHVVARMKQRILPLLEI